jgi:hypothetical protein
MAIKSTCCTKSHSMLFFTVLACGIAFSQEIQNPAPEPSAPAQDTAAAASAPIKDTVAAASTPAPVQPAAVAFDTIAGPLPATVKKGKPYLVVGDIEVPAGKTVSIEQGAVFLFKSFTGLHVQGKLVALGTRERSIVFTSENDRSVNPGSSLLPSPYDWNGIYIHADGLGTSMAFCKVMYTVYGIVSETKFIRLDPVMLRSNGKSNLVIEGKEQTVTDKPFSYVLTTKDAMIDGVPVKILKDPVAPKRNIVRYISLAGMVAGAAGGAYYGVQWKKNQDFLAQMSSDDPQKLREHSGTDWAQTRDLRNKDIWYSSAGALVTVLGAAGLWWSFTF